MTQRVALVTGGSRGIGARTARKLAARGLAVGITYRENRHAAEEVVSDIRRHGGSADAFVFDMQRPCDASSVAEQVLGAWGRLDHVVANAGVWAGGRIGSYPEHEWWQVVETNVRGSAAIARAGVEAVSDVAGSITFVSSAVGLTGFPGDTAYAMAKSSFVGLARSLAKELGPVGVRVNVFAPGFVETDMTAGIGDNARNVIEQRCLLDRFATLEETATALAFLVIDATYMTGAVLVSDGGWTI